MSKVVYFLVDKLDSDKVVGATDSVKKFLHNLQRFSMDYYTSFLSNVEKCSEEFTDVKTCGRYLCLIQMSKEKNKAAMMFYDLGLLDSLASLTANEIALQSCDKIGQLFLEEYYKQKKTYKEQYYSVELVMEAPLFN